MKDDYNETTFRLHEVYIRRLVSAFENGSVEDYTKVLRNYFAMCRRTIRPDELFIDEFSAEYDDGSEEESEMSE